MSLMHKHEGGYFQVFWLLNISQPLTLALDGGNSGLFRPVQARLDMGHGDVATFALPLHLALY